MSLMFHHYISLSMNHSSHPALSHGTTAVDHEKKPRQRPGSWIKTRMGKLWPGGRMRLVWLFDPAHQTCQNNVFNFIVIIILLFIPCNAHIPPIDGIEMAQSILVAFMDFF